MCSRSREIVIYTDGSRINVVSGTGVYFEDLRISASVPLGAHSIIFQAEVLAILVDSEMILQSVDFLDRKNFLTVGLPGWLQ